MGTSCRSVACQSVHSAFGASHQGLDLAVAQGDQEISSPKPPDDGDVRRRLATLPRLPADFNVFDAREGQLLDAGLDGRLQRIIVAQSDDRPAADHRPLGPLLDARDIDCRRLAKQHLDQPDHFVRAKHVGRASLLQRAGQPGGCRPTQLADQLLHLRLGKKLFGQVVAAGLGRGHARQAHVKQTIRRGDFSQQRHFRLRRHRQRQTETPETQNRPT